MWRLDSRSSDSCRVLQASWMTHGQTVEATQSILSIPLKVLRSEVSLGQRRDRSPRVTSVFASVPVAQSLHRS